MEDKINSNDKSSKSYEHMSSFLFKCTLLLNNVFAVGLVPSIKLLFFHYQRLGTWLLQEYYKLYTRFSKFNYKYATLHLDLCLMLLLACGMYHLTCWGLWIKFIQLIRIMNNLFAIDLLSFADASIFSFSCDVLNSLCTDGSM